MNGNARLILHGDPLFASVLRSLVSFLCRRLAAAVYADSVAPNDSGTGGAATSFGSGDRNEPLCQDQLQRLHEQLFASEARAKSLSFGQGSVKRHAKHRGTGFPAREHDTWLHGQYRHKAHHAADADGEESCISC